MYRKFSRLFSCPSISFRILEERIGIRTSSAVPAVLFVPDAAGGESEGDSLQFNLRGSLQIQNSIDSSGPNDVADSQQQASQPSERLSTEVQKPDDTAGLSAT